MEYDSKSIDRQIQEISSKHCIPVLRIIQSDEGITHGELAEQMDLLPSGLSAVTKKMEKCDIPLLNVMQSGKYRKYFLPEYIRQYFHEQEEEKSGDFVHQIKEENLFLLLQHFVEAAGESWRDTMNLLLQEEKIEESSNIGKTFVQFMRLMEKKIGNQQEEVQTVRHFIKNEVLLYLLDKYIEASS